MNEKAGEGSPRLFSTQTGTEELTESEGVRTVG